MPESTARIDVLYSHLRNGTLAVKLADVAELNPPLAASLSDGDEVSFIPMAAVDADSVTAVDRETRSYSEVSKGYTPFIDGDVLVAKITPCFENGKIAQARLSRRYGFGSTEFHVVRPRNHRADARYLAHFLRQECIRKQGESRMTGSAGQRRVPEHFLAGLTIPLLPLPEQRRIAEILDKADALRAKRRAALAQLDTLTQSIFLDMFGDPATNPKGWPIRKTEDVAEIVSGATPRTDNESYWDGDVNWVTPKELSSLESMYIGVTERRITRQGLVSCAASILPPGSVLFSSRAPIGHTAICTAPMATNQGFKSFVPRPEVMEPHFLLFWLRLRRSFLEGLGTGATFKEVSKAVVARIDVCVPPFDLQSQFARRVVALERIRSVQREERGQLDTLFTSLQHHAFRGEL
jgi:type I restriction enzyme S subunit